MRPTAQAVHTNAPLKTVSIGSTKAEIDLTPPAAVQAAARRGLELRRKWGRGGLSTQEAGEQGIGSGVARAATLTAGKAVSPETIGRMVAFFSRHAKNYKPDKKEADGGPTAGTIAWLIWGGEPGRAWAEAKQRELKAVEKANHSKSHCMACKSAPPDIDVLWAGGKNRAWFCAKCFPGWAAEHGDSVVGTSPVRDGLVDKRFKIQRHSPKEKSMNANSVVKINGQPVAIRDLAKAWLTSKANRFSDDPWSEPAADLPAEDYRKVCLIDLNEPGETPVKVKCKLPVRSTPTGPYNKAALRNAAARISQTRDVPPDKLKAAARRLVALMREAGIEVGDPTKELAGIKTEKSWDVTILKADKKKQVAYGVPLKPNEKDSQKDKVSPEEIEAAAWGFMKNYGQGDGRIDHQHQVILPLSKAYPVESYLAPMDMVIGNETIPKGSWVLGVHVPDPELWKAVEKGEINAFSIRGWGKREAVR